MEITLYNTCPAEYDKLLKKISSQITAPALKEGKQVIGRAIKEKTEHHKACWKLNDTRFRHWTIREKKACQGCPYSDGKARSFSDLTMKISIK